MVCSFRYVQYEELLELVLISAIRMYNQELDTLEHTPSVELNTSSNKAPSVPSLSCSNPNAMLCGTDNCGLEYA